MYVVQKRIFDFFLPFLSETSYLAIDFHRHGINFLSASLWEAQRRTFCERWMCSGPWHGDDVCLADRYFDIFIHFWLFLCVGIPNKSGSRTFLNDGKQGFMISDLLSFMISYSKLFMNDPTIAGPSWFLCSFVRLVLGLGILFNWGGSLFPTLVAWKDSLLVAIGFKILEGTTSSY